MRELPNTDRVVEALHASAPQPLTVEAAAKYADITESQAYYRLERLHSGKLRVPGYAVRKEHGSLGENTRGHGGRYTIVPVGAVEEQPAVAPRIHRALPIGIAIVPSAGAASNGFSVTPLPGEGDAGRCIIKLPDGRVFLGKQL